MADKSITKTELVASIASATGHSQAAVSGVLDSLFSTVAEAVAKGSKVSIPGVLTITANRQTKNANGTFTVDGLVVELLGQETLTITSATCGNVTSRKAPHLPHEHSAPTPHPVHGNAPVTG